MTHSRLNLVLTALLVAVLAAAAFSRTDRARPNVEFLPDMKYSPAYTAFEAHPQLSLQRAMQPPVAGTIARGELPLHYAATPEDALRAGAELANPFAPGTPELTASQERGRQQYAHFCTACHGPQGLGDGPVSKRGFPPPPSLQTGKSVGMPDGQLFHILTYGQNTMPSFAAQLDVERRWDLINFIRTLQNPVTGAITPAPTNGPAASPPGSSPVAPQP
jgi:mono/diheme cytochrome c family protein